MPETLWYYARNDRTLGPIPGVELKRLAAVGDLLPGDLVWHDGLEQWAPANKIRGLFSERAAAPPASAGASLPPLPEDASAPPAAEVDPPLAAVAMLGDSPPPVPANFSPPPASVALRSLPEDRGVPASGGNVALFRVLLVVQIFLWSVCVLTVFGGGLLFVVRLVQTEDIATRASIGGLYAAFAIASYVVARAGEKVAQLILVHAERSDEVERRA